MRHVYHKLATIAAICTSLALSYSEHASAETSTSSSIPPTSQIQSDILNRINLPVMKVHYIRVAGNYAVADYGTGESGGDAFYIISFNKWKYICVMKGGVDLDILESQCGIPASAANALYPLYSQYVQ